MHFLCASDRIGRGFGQAKVADLADLNQLGHGTNGILNGRTGINSVLIVEIDHVDLQPAQGCLAGRTHIIGLPLTPTNAPSAVRTLPNLVASTTWSRRSLMAFPTSSSFRPNP